MKNKFSCLRFIHSISFREISDNISVKQIPSQPHHLLVHFFAATFIKTLTEDSNFVKLQADSESAFNGTQTTMASFQNIFAFICITLLARYLSHSIYNYTRRLITKLHG